MSQKTGSRKRIEAKRSQQRQRARIMAIALIAGGAVLLAVLLIFISRPTQVEVSDKYEGLTQSIDSSSTGIGLAIGNPDAPVTVVDYSDFSCPHCYDLAQEGIEQVIEQYVGTGDVRVIFKPIAFVNPPYSIPAAQAAICAAEQDMFWEMHDQIWNLYETGGPNSYTFTLLADRAERIGLDSGEFGSCFIATATEDEIRSVIEEAQALGINATPTVLVNGNQVQFTSSASFFDTLSSVIDSALADAS